VLPIKHLVDIVAQHVFADLGTFMLDRTVKAFIDADEKLLQGAQGHPAAKTFARREQCWTEKTAKLTDFEVRLTSVH
jgi:hypothetical protein